MSCYEDEAIRTMRFERAMRIPVEQQGDSLSARLARAKASDSLATEGELIDLESRAAIADLLPDLVAQLARLNDNMECAG